MLQTLLVLGLVPGTNIEIGFVIWAVMAAAILFFIVRAMIKHYSEIKSQSLMFDVRLSMPADRFHSRLR